MNIQTENKRSIIKDIVDGSIRINSIKEFDSILNIFPDDPLLLRPYADLLARKKMPNAAETYRRTTQLFLDSGMVLQAVVSQIMEWRIAKPSQKKAWAFYSALHKTKSLRTPVHSFFARLTFPELIAVMIRLERFYLPAGQTVIKFGNVEDALYFIVSGSLGETTYHQLRRKDKDQRKTTIKLGINDYFGNIFPLGERKNSQSHVKTITNAELIKIRRISLLKISKKHPELDAVVKKLYQDRAEFIGHKSIPVPRQSFRHQVPCRVRLKIFPHQKNQQSVVFNAASKDISMGGVCVALDSRSANQIRFSLIGCNVRLQLSAPDQIVAISILGTIVWEKVISLDGKLTRALGIQFKEIPPKIRGFLVVFARSLQG
ncbi:MAG: cyclic nucleotide-binding domain-containing protein [Desulfobacterales bacterium]|nr:cyclic nucleotide-binding domain-containing protein [Desulfobacterales bacterium]